MQIVVCGGRDYRDNEALYRALDRLHTKRGIEWIIQGGADGSFLGGSGTADIARRATKARLVVWKRYG